MGDVHIEMEEVSGSDLTVKWIGNKWKGNCV